VQIDRLEPAGVPELQGEGPVVDEAVFGQVQVLEKSDWISTGVVF